MKGESGSIPNTPGTTSGSCSFITHARRVLLVYWILLAIGTHVPHLGVGEDANQIGFFQVDKTLHVIAFAGLAWLLYRARIAGRSASDVTTALVAACIAVIYALADEYTQGWTGREVSYSDVVAGLVGIVGVFLILTAGPPRAKTGRFTRAMRVLTLVAIVGILVIALVPKGNDWVNGLAQPFFQPWPGFDKAGHFYVSAVLTLMLALSQPAGIHHPRRGLFLSILVMGLAGPIIETAQSFTGRGVEMADLYAHQLGLLAAMAALAMLAVFRALCAHFAR